VTTVDSRVEAEENEDIVLGVLDVVERDASVTQRSVARELGIALGLANTYLRRCVRKGLIKVSQVPTRRYAYYLTPQGMAEKSRLTATYLSNSFSFFRQARVECGELYATAARRGQARFALVGDGDLAQVAILVAREHPVEIAGIIAAARDAETLAAGAAALGQIDAVLVTSTEYPHEVCAASIAAFGAERVLVPPLLRVHLASIMAEAKP
jgi:hypothetical protein